MPRFYMHLANDQGITMDEDGREFDSPNAAVQEASRSAGDILADELLGGSTSVSLKLYLEDAAKHRVATISVHGSLVR